MEAKNKSKSTGLLIDKEQDKEINLNSLIVEDHRAKALVTVGTKENTGKTLLQDGKKIVSQEELKQEVEEIDISDIQDLAHFAEFRADSSTGIKYSIDNNIEDYFYFNEIEGETKREHADIEPDLKIQLNELCSSKANSKRVVIKNVLMKYGLADDIMKGKLIINSYSINFLIDNSSKLENVKDNSQNSKQDEIYDKDKKIEPENTDQISPIDEIDQTYYIPLYMIYKVSCQEPNKDEDPVEVLVISKDYRYFSFKFIDNLNGYFCFKYLKDMCFPLQLSDNAYCFKFPIIYKNCSFANQQISEEGKDDIEFTGK